MPRLDTLAILWAAEPNFTDDVSNDFRERSMEPMKSEMIRQRNTRHPASMAECGHCGRTVNAATRRGMAHVVRCESDNRPYQYGPNR